MVSTQRRSRSPRSEVESRSLMARIPVSGVRTSCANAASAASTMPGPAGLVELLGGRLRDLRALTPEARFLGGRTLGDGILSDPVRRRERDFSAMIPPDPGRSHFATARLGESRQSEVFPLRAAFGKAALDQARPTSRRMSAGVAP